jgi:Uma2 family endonuclease
MSIQSVPTTKSTFDEFVNWYPKNSLAKYELHDGAIVEVPRGAGDSADIAKNICDKISHEIRRLNLTYSIPDRCLLKIPGKNTIYQPDIVVLERTALSSESWWQESSVILNPSSVRLVVELVDDASLEICSSKCWNYEDIGIAENWMVDYQNKPNLEPYGRDGLPCLTISTPCKEYPVNKFAGNEVIESVTFPYLNSTVNQFLKGSQSTSGTGAPRW